MSGGLGNQMFQYSFGYALSKKANIPIKYDFSFFKNSNVHHGILLNEIFPLEIDLVKKKEIANIIGLDRFKILRKLKQFLKITNPKYVLENSDKDILPITKELNDHYLDGYWQNWNYFIEYKEELNKKFMFNNNTSNHFKELEKAVLNSNSAIIHLRRGDYVNNNNKKLFHQLGRSYFDQGMKLIRRKEDNIKFYVFSDDINFAKSFFNYDDKLVFMNTHNSKNGFRDMHLMSMCKNIIISNSTFSWWAAWLGSDNKKTIVAPKLWFKQKKVSHEYYLPEWNVI